MKRHHGLWATALVYLVVCLLPLAWRDGASTVQSSTLVATGLVIVWYTWETMRLRSLTARQVELQLRPYVVYVPDECGGKVENVGHSVALNVVLQSVDIYAPGHVLITFPEPIPILRPGEIAKAGAVVSIDGKMNSDFLLAHLDPQYASMTHKVVIRFANAEGQFYQAETEIGPGHLVAGAIAPAPYAG